MKITTIGAGPVGAYSAWRLAQEHDVSLIEEHAQIGAPVQCTGILTDKILEFLPKKDLKSVTETTVTKTLIHSPSEKVELKIQPNYIIDNIAYCQMLAGKAQDKGADIRLNTRYLTNQEFKNTREGGTRFSAPTADILLGTDGPTSQVAKNNGLYDSRSFLTGVQAVVKVKDYDERIHFYPFIGEYAWYCPQGDGKARIGIAAPHNAKAIFDQFITRFPGRIECMQGGPIPLYHSRPQVEKRLQGGLRVQLIGDSVPQIKNTTGGGIIPGSFAADIQAKDPSSYAESLGPLHRELTTHQLINKAMRKFSRQDWDKLILQAQDKKIQHILGSINRDNAFAMAANLILKKPSLMAWARKII